MRGVRACVRVTRFTKEGEGAGICICVGGIHGVFVAGREGYMVSLVIVVVVIVVVVVVVVVAT